MLKEIFRVFWNELRVVSRDKGILIFIVLAPLLYPLLYSYTYTNEVVREVPCAVVDDSHSALSRELIRKVDATPGVNVACLCHSMAEAEERMKRREVYGILHIPSSFSKDVARGKQTHVGYYSDMGSMLYYKTMLIAVNSLALDMGKEIRIAQYLHGTTDRQEALSKMPVEYDYTALFNPQGGFACFLIPPVLMLIIQQTLLLGVGMQMGNTREKYGCPMPRKGSVGDFILGKALVYFCIYLVMAIYMFTVVTRSFHLQHLGDYWTFIAFVVPYILACIFFAMCLSFLVYRREDCILLFMFLSVPFLFVSGISWPRTAIPQLWQWVSCLIPSTFGMNGYVRIASLGASLLDVSKEFFALWVQAIAYFFLAFLLYERQGHVNPRHVPSPAPLAT